MRRKIAAEDESRSSQVQVRRQLAAFHSAEIRSASCAANHLSITFTALSERPTKQIPASLRVGLSQITRPATVIDLVVVEESETQREFLPGIQPRDGLKRQAAAAEVQQNSAIVVAELEIRYRRHLLPEVPAPVLGTHKNWGSGCLAHFFLLISQKTAPKIRGNNCPPSRGWVTLSFGPVS